MKIRIKQVPDAEPNADGEWIERTTENIHGGPTIWDRLTSLCDPGHHAVKYEKIDE